MRRGGRLLVAFWPWAWLLLFVAAPFAIVVKISLALTQSGVPPYTPLWPDLALHFDSYRLLGEDSLYVTAYLHSMKVALETTALCLLLGYPMAYAIARAPRRWRNPLLMLIVLPFWTSFLLRVYAWIGILKTEGLANELLLGLGLIGEPLPLLYNEFAMLLGMVYGYLPFMVLPLYATLERMDLSLLEAAADLGCRPWRAFLSITLPLSAPGVLAGSMLVFIPAVGEFVIPDLLGGPDSLMIGTVLWADFFSNRDWPTASAVTVAMLALLAVPVVILQKAQQKEAGR